MLLHREESLRNCVTVGIDFGRRLWWGSCLYGGKGGGGWLISIKGKANVYAGDLFYFLILILILFL